MEDGRLPKDILYSELYDAPRRTGMGNTCCRSQQMACLSEFWLFIVSHKLRRKNGEAPSSSSTTTGWAMMMMMMMRLKKCTLKQLVETLTVVLE